MTKTKISKVRNFFAQYPVKKFSKGQILFQPGDKIDNLYFIKSGYVRCFTKSPKGENTLNLFKPLFLMSVIHFVSEHRNDFYFEAITPVEAYEAPKSDFKKLMDEDKDLSITVMEFFYGSLLQYFVNQGSIINGAAINKVASVLLQLTNDYGDTKDDQLIVSFPATHRIIANLVGLTRETTSVQMSRLQKSNVISTKRSQFVVKNLNELQKLSELSY